MCRDYGKILRNELNDCAEIWMPDGVVESSLRLLEGIRDWVLKRQPDLVYVASGLLDTRKICYGVTERLVPLEAFGRNVQCALNLILERSTAIPVWGTIAPVDRRRYNGGIDEEEAEFDYDNESISLYNEEAKAIAERLGVSVVDVYGFVKTAARDESVRPDGLRFDEIGSRLIARKVAKSLRELMA